MQFSCPMWGPEEGGVRGDLEGFRKPGDLEAAQARKINYALKQARLRPKDRLLEIGCGWGTVALAVCDHSPILDESIFMSVSQAGKMGCSVDALTLSFEQKAIADQRIKEAGLESQVRIHLMDYRNMPPEFEKAFDACISIEMVEVCPLRTREIDQRHTLYRLWGSLICPPTSS
jgi:cyclopropane-fatty-acyl-phospholipid synthase